MFDINWVCKQVACLRVKNQETIPNHTSWAVFTIKLTNDCSVKNKVGNHRNSIQRFIKNNSFHPTHNNSYFDIYYLTYISVKIQYLSSISLLSQNITIFVCCHIVNYYTASNQSSDHVSIIDRVNR